MDFGERYFDTAALFYVQISFQGEHSIDVLNAAASVTSGGRHLTHLAVREMPGSGCGKRGIDADHIALQHAVSSANSYSFAVAFAEEFRTVKGRLSSTA